MVEDLELQVVRFERVGREREKKVWREGWKRLEEVERHWTMSAWGRGTRRGLKTFLYEMSSKKQTVCRAKRLRVVCAGQT
ncbi:hypothetical protein Hanom_Chr11g01043031 [Helianthus anomalus]